MGAKIAGVLLIIWGIAIEFRALFSDTNIFNYYQLFGPTAYWYGHLVALFFGVAMIYVGYHLLRKKKSISTGESE